VNRRSARRTRRRNPHAVGVAESSYKTPDWCNSFADLGGMLNLRGAIAIHEAAEGGDMGKLQELRQGFFFDFWHHRPLIAGNERGCAGEYSRPAHASPGPELAMKRSTGKIFRYPCWKGMCGAAPRRRAAGEQWLPASKNCKAKLAMKDSTGQRILPRTTLRDLRNAVAPKSKSPTAVFSKDFACDAFRPRGLRLRRKVRAFSAPPLETHAVAEERDENF
jgi:hypothetical protein